MGINSGFQFNIGVRCLDRKARRQADIDMGIEDPVRQGLESCNVSKIDERCILNASQERT